VGDDEPFGGDAHLLPGVADILAVGDHSGQAAMCGEPAHHPVGDRVVCGEDAVVLHHGRPAAEKGERRRDDVTGVHDVVLGEHCHQRGCEAVGQLLEAQIAGGPSRNELDVELLPDAVVAADPPDPLLGAQVERLHVDGDEQVHLGAGQREPLRVLVDLLGVGTPAGEAFIRDVGDANAHEITAVQ
jgi:hypothetical protein